MANTLGNPTIDTAMREAIVSAVNTQLLTGSAGSATLRIRNSTTTLVDFLLDDTNPLTLGSSDGQADLNFQSSTATATGGSATVPDNYQILDQAGTVRMSGAVSATDGITSGQSVDVGTITLTMPAS